MIRICIAEKIRRKKKTRRILSLFLALILAFSCITPAFAEELSATDTAEESSQGTALPTTQAAPPAEEDSAADAADAALPAEETTLSDDEQYLLNIVLFSLRETAKLSSIEDELGELGLSSITPVFTNEDGTPKPMGKKHEVWYRAYTAQDANEVTESLMALKGVTYAEPEYVYTSDAIGEPTEVEQQRGWAYDALLKLDTAFWWNTVLNHDFAPGKGAVVAVIDTGVDYTHEDLAANMWVNEAELNGTPGVDDDGNGIVDDIYGMNATANGSAAWAGDPMDDNGHGTHVAGIIAMSPNGVGGVGLAYGAKLMAIKAGQSTGSFASSHIARAIDYAHMMGADVINMSFGGTGKSYLVESALEDAFADCVLVASAGNDGLPTTDAPEALYPKSEDIYPAGYAYVLGVMATDKLGKLASFSNWDYKPNASCEYELTAPGADIYSTLPGDRYAQWSGTSMAAPCVSAAAAILRSSYADKSTYSARFIMGQLSSATEDTTYFLSPQKDKYYAYPALNIYDSVTKLPKPNITVKDTFLMDSTTISEFNDGDGIIDAGETIDLGVLVRNQWGLTGEITVQADALSIGGVANPHITFLTDTVTLAPAGTFQEVNNGFVYDDSLLTAVSEPIRFTVASDTPNDTAICINLTVTTSNGVDAADTATYTVSAEHTFRVQAGRGISGTLTEDTTLTNDYLWIVENTLLIPEGITLTIEPGTKVQFYSSDYEDAYGGLTIAAINCEGTLNAIGTADAPIELYPGAGFEQYCVQIGGSGLETLRYCNVVNPYFTDLVNVVDHCELVQTFDTVYHRYVYGSSVESQYAAGNYIGILTNTVIRNLSHTGTYTSRPVRISTSIIENCLFENCCIYATAMVNSTSYRTTSKRNVYLSGGEKHPLSETICEFFVLLNSVGLETARLIGTYEGKSYILLREGRGDDMIPRFSYYTALANALGGSLAVINDQDEYDYLAALLPNLVSISGCYLGARYDIATNQYRWIEKSDYVIDTSSFPYEVSANYPYVCWTWSGIINEPYFHNTGSALIEIPEGKTEDEIKAVAADFDYDAFLRESCSQFVNNAVLNPVLNNTPDTWSKLISTRYNASYAPNYATRNYWGTENSTLINKMIVDADDFAGTYQDIVETPILTLESESLADIYPFVTRVYLTDEDGNLVSSVSGGETYTVHVCFNRDMAQDIQPSVSFGGEAPYTDYAVSGGFVSAREWQGSVKISPVLTGGTMYWRTKGGAAADDTWLVCGEDVLRFSFNISSTGALAMLLNAEGGTNRVELTWAQNDYETLAGYNLYRSTSETGSFTKLNTTIVTGNAYTDTEVDPGVTYYYYFKVVNTDGNEEENVSNTASGTPLDNIFPVLRHAPVTGTKAGSAITISATATDNIAVESVKLYYRRSGTASFTEQAMTLSATADLYVATIPASVVTAAGVEYYIAARDADGNTSYSGTANIPNVVAVNSAPYILSMTPTSVGISGGRTVSILGGNLSADMTLKLGDTTVAASDVSFIDQGQINFLAPAMASGSYAVTLTTADGKSVTTPTPLSYTDSASTAEIPTTMTMTSGTAYTIPFYATASGDIISVHAELDLPYSDFSSVVVEKADESASFTLEYNYSGGVLKLGCIGSSRINGEGALVNIIVTPQVSEDKQYTLKLHDVSFNGVAVSNTISGEATLKPSYAISASVQYYAGTQAAVKDVTITAAGVSGVTDENGSVSITVPTQTVTISAKRSTAVNAVTAYDASLVLQSAVGKVSLSDNQRLAADVSGDGRIDEYDAALILQKAVRKLDAFPASAAWVFVPSFQEKTLSASTTTSVSFTAISLGDVDGSYGGETA